MQKILSIIMAASVVPFSAALADEADGRLLHASVHWTPWLVSSGLAAIMTGQALYGVRQTRRLRGQLGRLREENSRLRKRADIDPMTGFLNREAFMARLSARRRRSDMGALLLIDADHFKQVNDRFGHQAGDEALMALGKAMGGSVRQNDLVGRIGGEEFAVLLAGASSQEAVIIAERIRCAVEAVVFEPQAGVRHRLTVSIGGVSRHHEEEPAAWLRAADTCLYQAKSGGRNLVVIDGGRARAA